MSENGKNKVFRSKQASSKVSLLFLNVKMFEERFQQTRKVRRMHLAFKNLKTSRKWGTSR